MLVEFIQSGIDKLPRPSNSYISHSSFEELYLRITKRYLENKTYPCIDIARVQVKNPGKGTFKYLIAYIQNFYPQLAIFVECVLDDRFADGLIRMGFARQPFEQSKSFYLLPQRNDHE